MCVLEGGGVHAWRLTLPRERMSIGLHALVRASFSLQAGYVWFEPLQAALCMAAARASSFRRRSALWLCCCGGGARVKGGGGERRREELERVGRVREGSGDARSKRLHLLLCPCVVNGGAWESIIKGAPYVRYKPS